MSLLLTYFSIKIARNQFPTIGHLINDNFTLTWEQILRPTRCYTNDLDNCFEQKYIVERNPLFYFFSVLSVFIRIYRGSEEQETGVPRLQSDVMCQMLITGRSNYALHVGAFSSKFVQCNSFGPVI